MGRPLLPLPRLSSAALFPHIALLISVHLSDPVRPGNCTFGAGFELFLDEPSILFMRSQSLVRKPASLSFVEASFTFDGAQGGSSLSPPPSALL